MQKLFEFPQIIGHCTITSTHTHIHVCVRVNVHLIAFVALQLPALSSMTNGCRNYRLMLLTYVAFA